MYTIPKAVSACLIVLIAERGPGHRFRSIIVGTKDARRHLGPKYGIYKRKKIKHWDALCFLCGTILNQPWMFVLETFRNLLPGVCKSQNETYQNGHPFCTKCDRVWSSRRKAPDLLLHWGPCCSAAIHTRWGNRYTTGTTRTSCSAPLSWYSNVGAQMLVLKCWILDPNTLDPSSFI